MNSKRFIATLSGLALLLALGSPVLAATDKTESTQVGKAAPETLHAAKRPAAKERTISGEVASVDEAAKTVTVKAKGRKGQELTVGAKVEDQTTIREGKTTKTLADLKAGDKVRLKYVRTADGDVARSILIRSAGK